MYVIPGVVYLSLGLEWVELVSSLAGYMAAGTRFISGDVGALIAQLTENITGKIPVQEAPGTRYTRAVSFGDYAEALLIDFLKQKRGVVAAKVPAACEHGICGAIEHKVGLGVFEFRKVIVVSVDDHGTVANELVTYVAAVETIRGGATHGFGEAKRQEAHAGHEHQDETDQTHLLSPSPLLFGCVKTTGSHEDRRHQASHNEAIGHPRTARPRTSIASPLLLLYLRHSVWDGSRACALSAKGGTTLKQRETRLMLIFFATEKRSASP